MANSGTTSVFISYARKDGADLARRLLSDLENEGLDVWLDTRDLAGGSTWTKEIERALDRAVVVLTLLTEGSYISEICRAEQLRALRQRKCVIPLLVQPRADIFPLHLEGKNYRDFSSQYDVSFGRLLSDIRGLNGVSLEEEFRETYVTAPPLPANYVERPDELDSLRDEVITEGSSTNARLLSLSGMGGIGKSVLAQALCHNEIVQQAFPDGIVWVSIGKKSTYDFVTKMREVGKALKDDLTRYDSELGCKHQYRTTMRKKSALLVLDDVWDARDLEPFQVQSRRSRALP